MKLSTADLVSTSPVAGSETQVVNNDLAKSGLVLLPFQRVRVGFSAKIMNYAVRQLLKTVDD